MINICFKCKKILSEGDLVEMTVMGVYRAIQSSNSFRLDKDIIFKTGTLAHADCEDTRDDN